MMKLERMTNDQMPNDRTAASSSFGLRAPFAIFHSPGAPKKARSLGCSHRPVDGQISAPEKIRKI
jgi:hypothetical protein